MITYYSGFIVDITYSPHTLNAIRHGTNQYVLFNYTQPLP
jgi:hypothetical protein